MTNKSRCMWGCVVAAILFFPLSIKAAETLTLGGQCLNRGQKQPHH